jgi:peptide/nickel transport system substrate-binding protein
VSRNISTVLKSILTEGILLLSVFSLSACSLGKTPPGTLSPVKNSPTPEASPTATSQAAQKTPTLEPPQARLLTICLGEEPTSLFLYGDNSAAAKSVLQAVYDGPYDLVGFEIQPVIFDQMPSLENGGAKLEPVQVKAGDVIVDNYGNLVKLAKGTLVRPSGCKTTDCAKAYSGSDPISLDQLTVAFKLKPGLKWSDGSALTADDSVYSFQVARQLYPVYRPDLINATQSYLAKDALTVEWKGIPGYESGEYSTNFFSPLPRHAWGSIPPDQLASTDISSRSPIGWGPYIVQDWVAGDHITLIKNPFYFRANEGLPHFDQLVYRFVSGGNEAVDALLAGECDLIDRTVPLDAQASMLSELQKEGKINLLIQKETAWEQITFGITPFDPKRPSLFASKQVRQAVAQCIDRPKIAAQVLGDQSLVIDSDVPPDHPLYNPDIVQYRFDPQKAADLLAAAGWLDEDNNPATPRISSGVAGIPDGTPFEFTYLASNDTQEQKTAQLVAASLAQCGLKADISTKTWDELLAAGPDGPIFGRNFDMAQFAWTTSLTPACDLYLSNEVPGPYPEFPKGWGGANGGGYSNAQFDAACTMALTSLSGTDTHKKAVQEAQAIFSEDLPALPLYSREQFIASRPDLCGLSLDSPVSNGFWNLESLDYGTTCLK